MLLKGGLLLGCLAAGATPAPAQAMSRFVQLQVAAETLGELLHQRLLQEPMCPSVISCDDPNAPAGSCLAADEVWLDHIAFNDGWFFQAGSDETIQIDADMSLEAEVLQFVQPVTIQTRTRACIEDPSCNTFKNTYGPSLLLNVFADKGQICAQVTGFNIQAMDQYLPESVKDPLCAAMDLGDAGGLLGEGSETRAVGISPTADLSKIAFRFEMGGATSPNNPEDTVDAANRLADWESFYAGNHGVASTPESFTLFITQRLLKEGIGGMLSGIDDSDELKIDAGPWVSWDAAGGPSGKLTGEFDAHAEIGACLNDISLSPVLIDLPLSVDPATESIDVAGSISWDVSDWDLFLCAVTTGFFDPIASSILFGVLEDGASGMTPGDIDFPDACESTGDTTFSCNFPVSLPILRLGAGAIAFASLDITGSSATSGGLMLKGTATPHVLLQQTSVALSASSVSYGLYGGCNDLHGGYEGSVRISGFGKVCDITVSEDKLKVYGVHAAQALGPMPATVDIVLYPGMGECSAPDCIPATNLFWDNPYGLRVTAYTSAGAKSIYIDPPVQATSDEVFETAIERIDAKVGCMSLETGLFGIPGMYDPHWDIDPPNYDLVTFDDRGNPSEIGKVTVIDVFGKLGNITDERGGLNTRGVEMGLLLPAVIETRSFGNMEVELELELTSDLLATYDREGRLSRLDLSNGVSIEQDLSRYTDELPRGSMMNLSLEQTQLAIVAGE